MDSVKEVLEINTAAKEEALKNVQASRLVYNTSHLNDLLVNMSKYHTQLMQQQAAQAQAQVQQKHFVWDCLLNKYVAIYD